MVKSESAGSGFDVKTVDPGMTRAAALQQPDAALGCVIENRALTKPGKLMKHHISACFSTFFSHRVSCLCLSEFELPQRSTAQVGDYLTM